MKLDAEKIEELKQSLGNGNIKVDDPKVKIAEIQLSAVQELADEENEIFSSISPSEVFDVSRAYVFSRNSLPSVTEKLKKLGIEKTFSHPYLEHFLDETFRHRHKIDGKRTRQYIEALNAIAPKTNLGNYEPEKPPLVRRLV